MKTLLLDPFSGISGDMFLGALVDLGAPFDTLRDRVLAIPDLDGVAIEREAVTRGVFAATRIRVSCPGDQHHRSFTKIRSIIEGASLAPHVKEGAIRTFMRLAEAEAKVHGTDVDTVHFHEVGALDAIVDIVGVHVALDLLGCPELFTRPLNLGSGTVRSAHGPIPVPAPATLELLAGFPVVFSDRPGELVTPTGAALVASTAQPLGLDAMLTPGRVGYGAGEREGEGVPNVLRAMLAEGGTVNGTLGILTSTIDDMNPELYGHLMESLFEQGALEVYYNPIMMKKNRPGIEVTVICETSRTAALCDHLMNHTTTLGVRVHREERVELAREKGVVETPFGPVDVKVARRPDGRRTMSPEYESCRSAARRAGVSVLSVYEAAQLAWQKGAGAK